MPENRRYKIIRRYKINRRYKIYYILVILLILILIFINALYLEHKALQPLTETSSPVEIYFCPRHDCEQIFINQISKAGKVECALYDLDSEKLIAELKNKENKNESKNENKNADTILPILLIESNNAKDAETAGLKFQIDKNKYLMHNKFCILDSQIIITGSTNPTNNGFHKNNNNLLIINSTILSKNYKTEFDALFDNAYNSMKTKNTKLLLNNNLYQNYFCPQDDCKVHVLSELNKAEKSIYFMTFSFTDDNIGNLLVIKHGQGINISGVMEKTQAGSSWSEFDKLKTNGIDVVHDKNRNNMHHKVFIIDEKTVITGSYNPTSNGNSRNNENLLIIEDEKLAAKYLEEFFLLKNW